MHSLHGNFRIATPLFALWHWLMAKPGQQSQTSDNRTVVTADLQVCVPHHHKTPGSFTRTSAQTAPHQPLRVLRVKDADLNPAQTGRLRISGRMADVCAELDRLAALEAGFH